MSIIALQTATDACSVALAVDGRIVFFEVESRPRRHGEMVAPMIASVMEKLQGNAPEAVAVASGPGSYTGLRIGVSSAKGAALALDVPMIAVPTLHCVAHAASTASNDCKHMLCVLHARADEWYGAWFTMEGVTPKPDQPAIIQTIPEWKRIVAEREDVTVVVGGGPTGPWHGVGPQPVLAAAPTARDVAILATGMLQNGETVDVDAFEPAYMRDFVARMPKQSIFDRLQF